MNKQATALENAARRTDQTNSDSGATVDSHWYSITRCCGPMEACSNTEKW